MISPLSKASSSLYVRVARPILFRFSADSVHSFITRAGIITQSVPFVSALIRWVWRYDNVRLHQKIVGTSFKNPIGLSAGFDKEVRLPKLMNAVGFGLTEVGSITAKPYEGNPKPWYTRLPHTKSVLVYSGLRSSGVKAIAKRADRMPRSLHEKMPINASVAKTNSPECNTVAAGIEDYCESLKRLEMSPWPTMYTINISCPNTSGGEPFNKPENLQRLLDAIDELDVTRPVFLKLPIDLEWAKVRELIEVAASSSLKGLTLGNLAKDRSLVDPRDAEAAKNKGNLSGKPCWNASNALLARTYAEYGDRFILIGVGGVFSAEDAYQKIRLGASLVEMITGMIYQGPAVIGTINSGLVELMDRDGVDSISDAVGLDAKKYVGDLV